uniref:non-specific serine/threonine protein kinase n=1 Tax=Setaria italica TaxID=4555 RepID=K3YGJ6_SETIT
MLALTSSSHIVLSDGNGRILWRSNSSSIRSSPATTISAEAALENTGNFILRPLGHSTILWQSFDHPADTLLPGMNLRISHKMHPLQHLISWKGPQDPSPGAFSYGADPDCFLQRFIWNGTRPHRRSPVWSSYFLLGSYTDNFHHTIYMAVHRGDDDEVYMSFGIPIESLSLLIRMEISYSGKVNILRWNSNMSAWTALYTQPAHECNVYAYCGPYGYCDNSETTPTCKCPDGFEPKDDEDWNKGRFLEGCRRKKALRCSTGDGFLTLPGMKVPDHFLLIRNKSFDECTVECRSNCSCMAYAYANMSTRAIDGDDTRCLIWTGMLIDTEKCSEGGENLYIRTNKLSGLISCFHLSAYLTRQVFEFLKFMMLSTILSGKQGSKEIWTRLMLGDMSGTHELADRKLDLPLISFREIAVATQNFSDSAILGRGGFGTVYKTTDKMLHLSSTDAARKSLLDWPTRFQIIKGIARGLLYLHQDSRLTIIHRDLKAGNVLLDAEMRPKISDFGTARIFGIDEQQSNTNRVVGTYGYMSPEYALEGIISLKSDVYSFGVLLLEVVSGLKISATGPVTGSLNLIAHAWSLWKDGNLRDLVDSSIVESCSPDEILRCIHIGLLLVQDNPNARPLMPWVVSSLENSDIELPQPSEPMYFSRSNYRIVEAGESSVSNMSLGTLEGR